MSYVGDNINADCGNWSFKGDTVKDFDKHVKKSVPLYEEGHDLICDISDFFVNESSIVYEIGCSTGALSIKLAQHNINKMKARFVGIDIENDMVDAANKNKKKYPDINVDFMAADALEVELEPSDLIVCYYTV